MTNTKLDQKSFFANVLESDKIKVLNKYLSFFNLLCALVIGFGGVVFFYDISSELDKVSSIGGYALLFLNFAVTLFGLLSPYLFLLLLNSLAKSRIILMSITLLSVFFAWYVSIGLALHEIIINYLLGKPVILNFEWGFGFLILMQFGLICALLFIPILIVLLRSVKTGRLNF